MSTTKTKFLYLLFASIIFDTNCYAINNNCEKIYQHCFNNIPKKMITFHQEFNHLGTINSDEINLRDLPIISSKNSRVIKKIKKNSKVQIKKIFFLKPNTSIKLKLYNVEEYEIINNYRFGKWYLIDYEGVEGFIFSDFVSVIKIKNNKYIRYRHIDSVDWTNNKIELQKNIELTLTFGNDNSIKLKGYAWHYQDGFFEINTIFLGNKLEQNNYLAGSTKLFLFDSNEIYLESDTNIFTGIYKKY